MNLNTIYEILDKDQQDLTDKDIINIVTYDFYDDIDESIVKIISWVLLKTATKNGAVMMNITQITPMIGVM